MNKAADDKLTLAEIDRILAQMKNAKDLTGELKGLIAKLSADAAARVIRELKLDIIFDASDWRVTKRIDDGVAFTLGEMQKSNYDGLREILLEGYNAGESPQGIADRIDEYTGQKFNTSPETIARTEIIGANNMASVEVYRQAGFEKKEWLSTQDDRVRPAHAAADGQIVGLDQPFIVGSSLLMFPGDKSAFVEDWIQCRCTVLAVE